MDGSEQVYVMNPEGSNQINRSNNAFRDFQPEWSPGMAQIVFMSIREHSNQQIYVMNAAGTGQTRLTNTGSLDFYPTWSPNGELISFVSDMEVSSNWQIFTMNPDGTQQTKLPDSNNNDREFEHHWSPDGTRIAVEVDDSAAGHPQVYVYGSDGSSRINISGNSVVDKSPSWGGTTGVPEPPVTVDLFLHGTGPNANPATLFLDDNPPTATTPKYRDSASVKFAGGNPWKQIGTWSYMPESGELTA
jgi:Tol biopolymer transport system component